MAETVHVSGVQFNYVNFLWKEIGEIRREHRSGYVVHALKLLTTLIPYLPKDIQKRFSKRTAKIEEELDNLLKTVKGTSILDRHLKRNRAARIFAFIQLPKLLSDVSRMLDKRGYMERTRRVDEGVSKDYLQAMKDATEK